MNWTVDDQPTIDFTGEEGDGEGGGSGGEVSAVYDVVPSTSGSQSGIEIQYVDSRTETFIPFTDAGVSFIGTDNTVTSTASQFRLSKASNSNIVITANGNTLTIGAYYT